MAGPADDARARGAQGADGVDTGGIDPRRIPPGTEGRVAALAHESPEGADAAPETRRPIRAAGVILALVGAVITGWFLWRLTGNGLAAVGALVVGGAIYFFNGFPAWFAARTRAKEESEIIETAAARARRSGRERAGDTPGA